MGQKMAPSPGATDKSGENRFELDYSDRRSEKGVRSFIACDSP
jgi:hypothetical protein